MTTSDAESGMSETVVLGSGAAVSSSGDLTEQLINTSVWTDQMVASSGIPVSDVPFITVGGGLGSLAMVDFMRTAGLGTSDIKVLGDSPIPSETYQYLARNSQIPDHERLRSDAGSVMDNIWGFPSYALREARNDRSLRAVWQVATEPVFAEYFTPRAGQVYRSVEA